MIIICTAQYKPECISEDKGKCCVSCKYRDECFEHNRNKGLKILPCKAINGCMFGKIAKNGGKNA